jgi:hypothetical protein
LKQKSIFIGNFFEKIFENPKKPYFRTLVRIQKQETEGIIPSVSSVNDPVICFFSVLPGIFCPAVANSSALKLQLSFFQQRFDPGKFFGTFQKQRGQWILHLLLDQPAQGSGAIFTVTAFSQAVRQFLRKLKLDTQLR